MRGRLRQGRIAAREKPTAGRGAESHKEVAVRPFVRAGTLAALAGLVTVASSAPALGATGFALTLTGPSAAAVAGQFGPVSGTVGFELDLGCFNLKGSAKVGTAVGVGVGIDSEGQVSGTFGGSGKGDFNGEGVRNANRSWGVKTEGKLAGKHCGTFTF
jgi:hypothetical protein